jgi:hypothetical protein
MTYFIIRYTLTITYLFLKNINKTNEMAKSPQVLTFVDGVLHIACSPATVHDLRHVVNRRRGTRTAAAVFFMSRPSNRLVARQQAASCRAFLALSACVV